MYVQYGCGFAAPLEWTNFDASPTLRWERIPFVGKFYTKNSQRFPANVKYGDIVQGLPVAEGCCRGIYASHVLEHLALEDFHKALKNTRKMLQAGGTFRLVVPDLEWAAREYVKRLDARDPSGNDFFLEETGLGRRNRERGVKGVVYASLRTSAHLWMWDAVALGSALEKHGFNHVRRCCIRDAEDQMFALVEEEGRFVHAVAMEARG
jgi:hypothetical protein